MYSEGSWIVNGQFLEQTLAVPEIYFLKYSQDGKSIFTFSRDSLLRKWDVNTGIALWEKHIDFEFQYGNKFSDISNDEEYVLYTKFVGQYDNYSAEVIKYDIVNDEIEYTLPYTFDECLYTESSSFKVYAFGREVTSVFSPDNNKIYSAVNLDLEYGYYTYTGKLVYWNTNVPYNYYTLQGNYIRSIVFSDDGKSIAYNSQLWFNDFYKKPFIRKIYLNNNVIDSSNRLITFSHDNSYLVSIAWYWDINNKSAKTTSNYNEYAGTNQIFMSRDDRYLVCITKSQFLFAQFSEYAYAGEVNFPDNSYDRFFSMNPINNDIAYGGTDGILRIFKGKIFAQELKSIFKAEKTLFYVGDTIKLNDYSYGNPINWEWDFGDGQNSSIKNPIHVYNDTGSFTIKLIVSTESESDTMIRENYIRINEKPVISVNEYNAQQNKIISIFPNPFAESTKFKFDIVQPSIVNLSIYNSLGQEIAELCNGWKQAGEHEINFNGSNLNSGVYFYKLAVGSDYYFGKLVLIR